MAITHLDRFLMTIRVTAYFESRIKTQGEKS